MTDYTCEECEIARKMMVADFEVHARDVAAFFVRQFVRELKQELRAQVAAFEAGSGKMLEPYLVAVRAKKKEVSNVVKLVKGGRDG